MLLIDLKRSDKTPEVILDTDKHLFQIRGNCLPENIRKFGTTVLTSYEEYLHQLQKEESDHEIPSPLRVHFRLGYFNSASAKFISDIMVTSGNFIKNGCNIKIYWYFDEDDHDMLEAGEEMSQMVNVPMEFVAVVKE